MNVLRTFGRFWWDFVVGDDWRIAAGVVLALAIGAVVASSAAVGASWVAPAIGAGLLAGFAVLVGASARR